MTTASIFFCVTKSSLWQELFSSQLTKSSFTKKQQSSILHIAQIKSNQVPSQQKLKDSYMVRESKTPLNMAYILQEPYGIVLACKTIKSPHICKVIKVLVHNFIQRIPLQFQESIINKLQGQHQHKIKNHQMMAASNHTNLY